MNFKQIIGGMVVLSSVAFPVFAGHDRLQATETVFYDRARVLSVQPIVEVVRVPTQREVCYTEEVVHAGHRGHTGASMVVGSIIGGVLGHQVGKGNGKKAATVAGTVIGAAVGRHSSKNHENRPYTTEETRCRTVNEYIEQERVSGYRVTYKYRGKHFTQNMDNDPGRFVRIRVAFSPI